MNETAVVDVGSNSVRLVIFRVESGAFIPFLNEKAMAGLGRQLRETRRLSVDGLTIARAALRRFAAVIEALGVARVEAVATAAVREAEDGAEFVRWVREVAGLPLRIISGEEEARLSALGVRAGASEAEGAVGDLGGSSLELVRLAEGAPSEGETFRLGPLAIMSAGEFNADRVAALVDAELARSAVLRRKGGTFFAVGGAWRTLGRIDMRLRNHPIGVLHGYEMSRAEAVKVAEFVAKQSRRSIEKLGDAAEKRADTLPYAAITLERVLKAGAFDRVVVSSYGLREGLLADTLGGPPIDRLVASAAAFGCPSPRARAFGAALDAWISPVLQRATHIFGGARDPVLRSAAAHLADIGALLHPDQRADLAFELVLRAPLAAISHPERAFLASAVRHRYTKSAPGGSAAYQALLDDKARTSAAALGAAMRLAADLSGRSETLLRRFKLTADDKILVLSGPAGGGLTPEGAAKRLAVLADLLGLEPRLEA